ncbi:MAG: dephospho-CoA kinase [Flavobacteriaceae bacterium]
MRIIGLTGSIGMGKSAVARMFAERGIPVFDADAEVHRLYAGRLAGEIEKAFPGTTGPVGVNRAKLAAVLRDDAAMKRLEGIVHPAVAASRQRFLDEARQAGKPAAVLEVPLLFETGGERYCDVVVLVSAPADIQRGRVLARPGMSVEKFEAILARQMPDAEKRRRADVVIDTSTSLAETEREVDSFLRTIAISPPVG